MRNKTSTLFLILGLFLSLVSKLLQANDFWIIGNLIVILAAICFVLAILFAFTKFQKTFADKQHKKSACLLALTASMSIVCFQVMMMLVLSTNYRGFFLLIPIIACGFGTWYFARKIFKR